MDQRTSNQTASDPLWYKDAVIYQIHVKSFFDANNDGIGDFAGLLARLDYISQIGINTIWLLPFYPSPGRDDGYDIADYRNVDPRYGSLADVKRLIREAHARNIRVITELVINHTSDQHPWFQRARRAKPGSVERNYYVWSDTDRKYANTRIIFCDVEKSNWTWDAEAGAYYWHRFYAHQPDLNFDNPRVLREVLSIMRFWLDLGIDGLRLDAVPYLVEREGTSNENLAETHAILKRIRAELDAHYHDRMLLAEANMWPEDAQQYFGADDECHMAFHFPLMPRMYMAIAQEDRFPITDIMRQTPAIPPNCQWAIFLRNHDELTLEMVTEKERDRLWEVYAADRRARLNLGIRRRLAPLMERDRRRIELMNCLLLTMPGTPVVYYGDEIGMGDNIHLGDRDGVRTPMQWSSDRNGGFSRADPAELVLPAIMSSLWGYEAVNVETQWRDPHSLLNWFRRMLVVRSRFRAFGRGTLRFLRPANRHVLAYLREYEGEAMLCVANISRTAQAVELDLAEFVGFTPSELSGGASFPPVGQLTYLFTLPPYGFYWFQLSKGVEPPAWTTSTPGGISELETLVIRRELSEIAEANSRRLLERDILPNYISARRWFQSKDQTIKSVELGAFGALPAAGGEAVYAEAIIQLADRTEGYALPVAIAWEDAPRRPFEAPLAMARVRRGRRIGLLTDAFATPAFAQALLQGLKTRARIELSDGGALEFRPSSVLDSVAIPADAEIEWPTAEQSNSTMIIGQAVVAKLLRRRVAGLHPESEMGRFLTDHGFDGTPAFLGDIVKTNAEGTLYTTALIQGFVRNQGNGWTWTLQHLAPIIDAHATPFGGPDDRPFESYRSFATTLGRRLGQMHKILGVATGDPDFDPEVVADSLAQDWAATSQRQLREAFHILSERPDDQVATALVARQAAIESRASSLSAAAVGSLRTRIHGDLHLGQLLVAGADVIIIDFEGEPLKSIEERRAKSSPMRDVAGLLRSFDYAATTVERESQLAGAATSIERARSLLSEFRTIARDALFAGYAEGNGGSIDQRSLDLIDLFMLEKVAYEIVYDATNRPASIDVPISGLSELAGRILETQSVS